MKASTKNKSTITTAVTADEDERAKRLSAAARKAWATRRARGWTHPASGRPAAEAGEAPAKAADAAAPGPADHRTAVKTAGKVNKARRTRKTAARSGKTAKRPKGKKAKTAVRKPKAT